MYVDRPELEEHLSDALRGDKYVIVHGESGNGKTWLYKRVLEREGVYFEVVNLSNANLYGGLIPAFANRLGELGHQYDTQQSEELLLSGMVSGLGGSKKTQMQSAFAPKGAFVSLLQVIRSLAGRKRAILVLDNFEQVADDVNILKSIASIIISADEEAVAEQNVKILLVGVPHDLKQLVAKVSNASTIANRLIEIPEVARMTEEEAISLMRKGFEEELEFTFSIDRAILYKDICWKTDRIAQQLHELCLKIAIEAERNGNCVSAKSIKKAESKWRKESLANDLEVIDALVNSRETKVGRKNQTLYALAICEKEDFKVAEIENILRTEFDVDNDVKLNLFQMLANFANARNPLLRRTPRGDAYRFISPKVRMALRAGLVVEGNKVVKVSRDI